MNLSAHTQPTADTLRQILADILGLGSKAGALQADTALLGSLPELDSMAVATILTAIEERFSILIDDDEISADIFETFGSLTHYIDCKLAAIKTQKP